MAHHRQPLDFLLGLGARHLEIGQHARPWVVLADPAGNPCCVRADRAVYADTGPLAVGVAPPRSLRHPSLRGPLRELCPEQTPKGTTKNRLHLDVRLATGDDPDGVTASVAERGGRELHPEWGELPWRLYADPSGNEFGVLPARS